MVGNWEKSGAGLLAGPLILGRIERRWEPGGGVPAHAANVYDRELTTAK